MSSKDKAKQEKADANIPNPALFAGLKWYEGLMRKLTKIDYFIMIGDYYNWHLSLQDYVSATSPFMSETDKTALVTDIDNIGLRLNNYMRYKDRFGKEQITIQFYLRTELMRVQTKVYQATRHLLLKTSEGSTGDIDFTAASRGG